MKRPSASAWKRSVASGPRSSVSRRAMRPMTPCPRWWGLIKEKVSRNWNRPAGAGSGLEVVIQVRVTRSGEVVSADIVQSSGNELFDDSTLRAVLKASPLPLPSDPKYYEFISTFNFRFNPEG
ncbi:MAG: cell envelope integrity protein TolA [Gammaproteobacteria bacterium]|nr:cell envelope integrity protein TolA [Gammaproteobacteria bacterium]